MRLLHYNPSVVTGATHGTHPGISTFANYFKIYNESVVPIDRTHTISIPIHTLSLFPVPELRPFTTSYEEICNERAQTLLARAAQKEIGISVFWSGGIDSTLALISLLKVATPSALSTITVLMSEDSITENPRFYEEHIHGKMRTDSSNMFPYLLGTNTLIVNGEHNDQVFGSDAIGKLIQRFGPACAHARYSRDIFFNFFNASIENDSTTHHFLDLFEKLARAAPVPIERNYDFLWWINFALKWQNVFMRTLTYTAPRNRHLITSNYVRDFYAPFYNTEEFQLWSMLNPDKKMKDSWATYKWAAKEVIYDYTKDTEYHDTKVKRGSLYNIIVQQNAGNFVDSDMHFHDTLDAKEYYNPENDFVL